MGPEPDQPTLTPSSDQADSDTAATSHDTGQRMKKDEMEDVYTWGDTENVSKTNWHHFWKLTLSYIIHVICPSWIGVQLEMKSARLRNVFTCPA